MKWTALITVMAAMVLCSDARAQQDLLDEPEADPFVIAFYFENDGTFVKRNKATDRHYTNGVKLTLTHQPAWAKRLASVLPFSPSREGEQLKTAAGYAFGQNIYTPDRIEVVALQPNDRPYAGWLYAGAYVQRATQDVFDHFEANIGLIGPSSLAEDTQRLIHDLFDATEPRGWDNQLSDEVGFDFTFRRHWKLPLLTSQGSKVVELIPQAGFTVGTVHRHAEVGALVRLGVNFPDDFGPGRIEQPAAATGLGAKQNGAYTFVRVSGRLVEYNLFLEGNSFRSSHGVEPETLVGEVQVGFVVTYGRLELGYSQTFLSQQFKGQGEKDSFGALTLSWTSRF